MWSTSVGGHLMKVVNLTGFTVTASCQKEIFDFMDVKIAGFIYVTN